MTHTPLANRFAEYAGRLRFEDLPAATVHEAKRRFIDSIATAVGAMPAEAYAIGRRWPLRVSGPAGRDAFRRRPQQRRVGDFRQRPADSLPRLQ